MDQKTWLWRKRSSEKTTVATEEEVQSHPCNKEVDFEASLNTLNEKLASALDECSAKDQLVQNYEKIAENAAADKHKAEEEVRRLKQEVDEIQKQKLAANERLGHLNSALKDCLEQLNTLREEQEKGVRDAVMKTLSEFEKSNKELEEKLTETSKKLADLTVESSHLGNALVSKVKLIEDLNSSKCQKEADFQALMTRLDSVEKENAFLRYEFRMLEKELDLRNEEMEYSRRLAEASNKQNLENVKKIKKLEGDCQRLRGFTRKRIPSPSVFEIQGRNCRENSSKKLGFLIDQVLDLEKENKILKENLSKKEEENFNLQKVKNTIGALEMRLMDDFVEMEKLAIVAIDSPFHDSLSDSSKGTSGMKEIVPTDQVASSDWLEDVTKIVLNQHRISQRNIDELIGDISTSLHGKKHPVPSKLLHISGYITWKSPTPSLAEESRNESDTCKSTVRDEFEKHLGGSRPGTALELESVKNLMIEIEKIHSSFQVEIEELKNEFEILKESKGISEDQFENQKVINEDLDTQLTLTKAKLNELKHKLSSVEVELDNKSQCCEELEGTCVELQLQLESITSNRYSDDNRNQEEMRQTDLDITKASAKLSECEQAISNLGKQLKALNTAKEMAVVEKVISVTDANDNKFKQQRPSLLEQMLSEDSEKELIAKAHQTKYAKEGALVIFPIRKSGGILGFLRKLMLTRKKGSAKNSSPYFGK